MALVRARDFFEHYFTERVVQDGFVLDVGIIDALNSMLSEYRFDLFRAIFGVGGGRLNRVRMTQIGLALAMVGLQVATVIIVGGGN